MQVAAMGTILHIPDQVTVPGPKISLMDLGDLEGDGTAAIIAQLKAADLGAAPPPGQERRLSGDYLASIIKQHHLNDLITLRMGSSVTVKTEGNCITAEILQKLMEAQLLPSDGNYITRRISIPALNQGIWLEKGEYRIIVRPLGRVPELGTAVFGIEFLVNQVRKKVIHLRAEICLTGLVYQAKRSIKAQEKITAADFLVREAEIGNRLEYYGQFPQECRTVKQIRPGDILMRNAFQPIPLVEKGKPITVTVNLDGVEVAVTAEAKKDGWLGDEISVMNSQSKQIFKAKVTGRNKAEVNTK